MTRGELWTMIAPYFQTLVAAVWNSRATVAKAVLLASVFGALALLISQFTRERRPTAGMTGALLGVAFLNAALQVPPASLGE